MNTSYLNYILKKSMLYKIEDNFCLNEGIKFKNFDLLKNIKLKKFQIETIEKMKIIENNKFKHENSYIKNKIGFLSDPILSGKSYSILGFIIKYGSSILKHNLPISTNNFFYKYIAPSNIIIPSLIIVPSQFFLKWVNKIKNNTNLNTIFIQNQTHIQKIFSKTDSIKFLNKFDCILINDNKLKKFIASFENNNFLFNRIFIDKSYIINLPDFKIFFNFCWIINPFVEDSITSIENSNYNITYVFNTKIINQFINSTTNLKLFIKIFDLSANNIVEYIINNYIVDFLNEDIIINIIYLKILKEENIIEKKYLKSIISSLIQIVNQTQKIHNKPLFNLLKKNILPITFLINFKKLGFLSYLNSKESYLGKYRGKKNILNDIYRELEKISYNFDINNIVIRSKIKFISDELNLCKPVIKEIHCLNNRILKKKFIADLQTVVINNNPSVLFKHFDIIDKNTNFDKIFLKKINNCNNCRKKNIIKKINSKNLTCDICCELLNTQKYDVVLTKCCQNFFHLSCFIQSLFNLKLICPLCGIELNINRCMLLTDKKHKYTNKKLPFLEDFLLNFSEVHKNEKTVIFYDTKYFLQSNKIIDKLLSKKKFLKLNKKNKKKIINDFNNIGNIILWLDKTFFEMNVSLNIDNLIIFSKLNNSVIYNIITNIIHMNPYKKINIYNIIF
jgi:hypothetical protein